MGTEFVASHVWRVVNHADLASRVPLLNSFVPNLVWLPGQIAKLTDLEGGVVQRTLQAMSHAVYREAPVEPHLQGVVAEAWGLIPRPMTEVEAVDLGQLNWFAPTKLFYSTRSARLAAVISALEQLARGDPIADKVVTSRYSTGLRHAKADPRAALLAHLRRFTP